MFSSKIEIREFDEKYLEDCLKISEIVGITFNINMPIKFVALSDKEIIGFSTTNFKKDMIMWDSMAVLYDFRKLGVGKLFLKKVIDIAIKNKIYLVEVYADERAYSFWENQGFKLVEELPTTYRMQYTILGNVDKNE
jgi:N-acetylglutamate synthase-like GNAT family acetyltransferase